MFKFCGDVQLVVKDRTFRRRYIAFLIISDVEIPYKNVLAKIRELEIENFGARGILAPIAYNGKILIIRTPHKLKDNVIKMIQNIKTISGADVVIFPLITTSSIKNVMKRLREMKMPLQNILSRKKSEK